MFSCHVEAISELRTSDPAVLMRRPVLERPLRTERLTLRPASADDAEPTWEYRRLESVNEWLTGCPADLDGYRRLFSEPERLATTVIVTLEHQAATPIIGDFMLRREDSWAQLDVADQAHDMQAELGWVLDPAQTGHVAAGWTRSATPSSNTNGRRRAQPLRSHLCLLVPSSRR